MRTALLVLLLVISMIVTSSAKSNPLNSIRPLQTYELDEDTGNKVLTSFCTTWATLYQGQHAWVTARHCIAFDDDGKQTKGVEYYVDGKRVEVFIVNATLDLAIFRGGPSADPLPVAFGTPTPLTPIWSSGYPAGSTRQHTVAGIFSNEREDGLSLLSIYNVSVARGMSGSPVLTMNNMVIGVMQRFDGCSRIMTWCPVSLGLQTEKLRAFLAEGISQ
jgi:hypothetical protein